MVNKAEYKTINNFLIMSHYISTFSFLKMSLIIISFWRDDLSWATRNLLAFSSHVFFIFNTHLH